MKILSYNIHKGFNFLKSKYVLSVLKDLIEQVEADVVCLQEVLGFHPDGRSQEQFQNQFEFLADRMWKHYAYGRNAVYTKGDHGNAVLSKFPILNYENQDISVSHFAQRGVLHVELGPEGFGLNIFCLHLDLFSHQRKEQVELVCERLDEILNPEVPAIVAGDLNDWRNTLGPWFLERNFSDPFLTLNGRLAKTFPSFFPVLPLDRIYIRNLRAERASVVDVPLSRKLSDHLPVLVEFSFG